MLKAYINKFLIVLVLILMVPVYVVAALNQPTDVPAAQDTTKTSKPNAKKNENKSNAVKKDAKANTAKKAMFIEGQDYTRLPNDVRNNPDVAQLIMADPNKVQVIFFFSYGCHGCELFHLPYQKWAAAQEKKLGNKVAFYRYPVSFNPQWRMLAKLYYTMEYLDPKGKLNDAIFEAIHKQGLQLWQEPVMQTFFAKHGYKPVDFSHAFNSFGVNRQMKQADEISKTYKITLTPDIIVNGPDASYRLDLTKADNKVDRFFQILDYLVQREVKLLPSK
jgi:thiol:disulfide interchange protein DsbA